METKEIAKQLKELVKAAGLDIPNLSVRTTLYRKGPDMIQVTSRKYLGYAVEKELSAKLGEMFADFRRKHRDQVTIFFF